ncbi:MAG: M67 family metallopeptidase [Bacteroidetes bacterium]|nr:M67 family metallopeptidase [Bacteroidota bacterium]
MIQINQDLVDQIIDHAQSVDPIEACGYLAGKGDVVSKMYPLTNVDHSPEHFSLDPLEQLKVRKEARLDGLDIIAVYHSHPASPARPSDEDIRLAHDPDIIYAIVSLASDEPVLKAYKIQQGNSVTNHKKVILNVDLHITANS